VESDLYEELVSSKNHQTWALKLLQKVELSGKGSKRAYTSLGQAILRRSPQRAPRVWAEFFPRSSRRLQRVTLDLRDVI
jgi:hypothetical protein